MDGLNSLAMADSLRRMERGEGKQRRQVVSGNGTSIGGPPEVGDTLEEATLKVLGEGDPWLKAEYGELAASLWFEGFIAVTYNKIDEDDVVAAAALRVPDRPARLSRVRLVAPGAMPKLGKGGSLRSRQAIIHSLVHTESWAIDLSWDIIARFGRKEEMPREFFDDFVRVAQDEGRHFRLLVARLEEIGSQYGALPAHDGLWDSAESTAHDLSARLAIEHCVHEARGLDVLPTTISRLRKGGDEISAKLLESVVLPEEITHCAAGVKWFTFMCLRANSGASFISSDLRSLSVNGSDTLPNKSSTQSTLNPNTSSCRSSLSAVHVKQTTVDCSTQQEELDESPAGQHRENPLARSSAHMTEASSLELTANLSEGHVPTHVVTTFHTVVRKYFHGPLKPPFNVTARAAAGFGPDWYLPLSRIEGVD